MDFCPLYDDRRKTVFWDVTACGLVEIYGRFGGACFLHRQDRRTRKIGISYICQTTDCAGTPRLSNNSGIWGASRMSPKSELITHVVNCLYVFTRKSSANQSSSSLEPHRPQHGRLNACVTA
jgi:hypothetical protein